LSVTIAVIVTGNPATAVVTGVCDIVGAIVSCPITEAIPESEGAAIVALTVFVPGVAFVVSTVVAWPEAFVREEGGATVPPPMIAEKFTVMLGTGLLYASLRVAVIIDVPPAGTPVGDALTTKVAGVPDKMVTGTDPETAGLVIDAPTVVVPDARGAVRVVWA
jgi:hypothetical protein